MTRFLFARVPLYSPDEPAAAAGDQPAVAAPTTMLAAAAAADPAKAAEPAEPAADAAKPAEFAPDPAKTDAENAEAKKAFDEAAAKASEAKAADDKAKAAAGQEDTPEIIAARAKEYKIDPPEGFELNGEIDARFREFSAKRKLDQAAVDELKQMQIDLYADAAAKHADKVAKWGEAVKADKELGGPDHQAKLGKAGAFLREYSDAETIAMLESTGFGNHPGLVRTFYRAGLAYGEGRTIPAGGAHKASENPINVLYGDS